MTLPVTLITPTEKRQYNLIWLEIETQQGSLVIQPGHAPLIAILAHQSELLMGLHDKTVEQVKVLGGIAHVQRTGVVVIVDE